MTTTGPVAIRDTIAQYLGARAEQTERRIDDVWEDLTASYEAGACTDHQFEYVLAMEGTFGDEPHSRWVFSHFLAKCAAGPALIGVTATDDRTFGCPRCLAEKGWIEDAERGGWFPCPFCNQPAYDLFMDGHFKSGHECPTCQPTKRRGRAGYSHGDEVREQAKEREDQHTEDELF